MSVRLGITSRDCDNWAQKKGARGARPLSRARVDPRARLSLDHITGAGKEFKAAVNRQCGLNRTVTGFRAAGAASAHAAAADRSDVAGRRGGPSRCRLVREKAGPGARAVPKMAPKFAARCVQAETSRTHTMVPLAT